MDLNPSTPQNYCEDKRVGNLFMTLNFSDEKQDINRSDKEIVTLFIKKRKMVLF